MKTVRLTVEELTEYCNMKTVRLTVEGLNE